MDYPSRTKPIVNPPISWATCFLQAITGTCITTNFKLIPSKSFYPRNGLTSRYSAEPHCADSSVLLKRISWSTNVVWLCTSAAEDTIGWHFLVPNWKYRMCCSRDVTYTYEGNVRHLYPQRDFGRSLRYLHMQVGTSNPENQYFYKMSNPEPHSLKSPQSSSTSTFTNPLHLCIRDSCSRYSL